MDSIPRDPAVDEDGQAEPAPTTQGAEQPILDPYLKVAVVGLGGAGCAVVQTLAKAGLPSTTFITLDADWGRPAYWPEPGSAYTHIRAGSGPKRGMGAGGDTATGARVVEESATALLEHLRETDLIFICAGLGGGTGSGGAPAAARIAREAGALTLGIATLPFTFEGPRRRGLAEAGLAALRWETDVLILVPCARVLEPYDRSADILATFRTVDRIVGRAIRVLAELPVVSGLLHTDFGDLRALVSPPGGLGQIGLGGGAGESRVLDATREALSCPLLLWPLAGARGILLDVRTRSDLALREVAEAGELLARTVDPAADVLLAARPASEIEGDAEATIVAFGYNAL